MPNDDANQRSFRQTTLVLPTISQRYSFGPSFTRLKPGAQAFGKLPGDKPGFVSGEGFFCSSSSDGPALVAVSKVQANKTIIELHAKAPSVDNDIRFFVMIFSHFSDYSPYSPPALEAVEAWHQASIKAGAATRLLMAAAKRADITQAQLGRILEVTPRELHWLSVHKIGPVKRVKSSELINP